MSDEFDFNKTNFFENKQILAAFKQMQDYNIGMMKIEIKNGDEQPLMAVVLLHGTEAAKPCLDALDAAYEELQDGE